MNTVQNYERGSHAKLNTSKSELMWLRGWRVRGDAPSGFKLVTKMKILGIYFSNGLVSVDNDNWRERLDKLENF